ncbi:hypothetical protein EDC22_102439 [Tepidamorphus gemmatus]|jgi:hypothetical protein|uniref:Uncharacterized protein n=1 Tax=Tepidamorphus gemmatus TaxID=747076 RepID=A0A4V2UZW3_9HYPH|nr:hypothetical protein [Tepidamorphus gemmatus]TCT12753.1 hypothetical protein EDC22_102439 [Tepidamorphus gemmatus]
MRPKTALLTIVVAAVLATTIIGVGTRTTNADINPPEPAMRSL